MKCRRRIAALALLGTILSGTFATVQVSAQEAESAATIGEKVQVVVNGSTIQDGGLMVDGRAFLSVRQLSDALQAFVTWDEANKKVIIEKPNVDILLSKDNTAFGKVQTGKASFSIFAQVDNFPSSLEAVKLTITDPKGNATLIHQFSVEEKKDDPLWLRKDEFKYDFKSKGDYLISCYLKQKDGEFVLVSQKKLPAI
ncbi:stalk domain-containing protein [Paenibacillus thiaminolyticus]|uniref:stalk domain-containing protein n=1 Tax=Paenibacillus thiaminolyticus TaxID=49283 RepID=UPI003D2A62A2